MSPKSAEQFAAIRQKRRAMIMQAALELFGNNGYHNTSISDIAREAGVSKGLLYNYFSGKEDLLRNIALGAFETGDELMNESLAFSTNPIDQLVHMIEMALGMVKANMHYWKLVTSLAFQKDVLAGIQDVVAEKNNNIVVASPACSIL